MVDDTAPTVVRLYVGGLAPDLAEADLRARFASFGTVKSIQVARDALDTNACRGFAYVNLEATEASVARCMKAYSGTKWRGRQLLVEHARVDYMQRLQVLFDLLFAAFLEPFGCPSLPASTPHSRWSTSTDLCEVGLGPIHLP